MVAAAYESRTHRKALVLRQVRSEEGEKKKVACELWHAHRAGVCRKWKDTKEL